MYVPQTASQIVQQLPSAIEIANQPINSRQAGWPSFGSGRTVSDSGGASPTILPPGVIAQQIVVKAAKGNTDTIWAGTGSLAGDDSYPLDAGDSLAIPVVETARPTMFSKTAAQKLYWAVVR